MARIFISYSRADRQFVDQFIPLIRRVYGNDSVWFDGDIYGGSDWWQMILNEIGHCEIFIYLVSNESLESPYCQAELREVLRLSKPILPVIVRRLKPDYPGNIEDDLAQILRKTQYVDMAGGFRNVDTISKLYAALTRLLSEVADADKVVAASTPTAEPTVDDNNVSNSPIRAAYIGGVFLIMGVIITGVFGLWQGVFANPQPEIISIAQPSSPTVEATELLTTLPSMATLSPTNTSELSTLTPILDIPEPEQVALEGVTSNVEWKNLVGDGGYVREFNGVDMVLVPAGSFQMGSTPEELDFALELCEAAADNGVECSSTSSFEDEAQDGDNTQTFSEPFWIDKTEVTRAQYQLCDAEGCTEIRDSSYSTQDNHPINRVTWFQAQAYCAWRDVHTRLPTEAEWEYAARGPDDLIFPWGNDFDGTLANHCDSNCGNANWSSGYNFVNQENNDGFATTSPVDSFENGASWVGAYNMVGNVWEWTSSLFVHGSREFLYPYNAEDGREADTGLSINGIRPAVRGGSFFRGAMDLRTTTRSAAPSPIAYPLIEQYGIRCVRSYNG